MARRLALTLLALAALGGAVVHGAGGGPGGTGAAPVGVALAAPPPRPLPFFYDLYTFRGDTGTTAVVASFAVRVGRLDGEDVDGETRYRFNVSLVLADTARGEVSRSDDSVFVAVDGDLDDEHLLHTHVETAARPSTTTVQRVLMFNAPTPGVGQLYTHAFDVPDYGGDELMISDVALGLPDGGRGWERGGASLALLPSSHFPGGAFDAYYEIYNLPAGHSYVTEITMQPVDATGYPLPGRPLRVRFTGESPAGPDGTVRELRRVDASLPPGRYRMSVTVTDGETGDRARRHRSLEVREWQEGATLVAACPVAPGIERPGCRGEAEGVAPGN